MVETRRHQQLVDHRQTPAQVRMDEGRVEIHHQDVGVHHGGGEPEGEHRDDRQRAEDENLEEVHARSGHPIHALSRMMDGMEVPEPGYSMESAVHPVLDEVRQEHDRNQLNQERQARHPLLQGSQHRSGRHPLRRGEADEGEHLHHEAADQVVENILAPFITEKRLLRAEGADALEGNEDNAGEENVEGEPVEAEEQRRRIGRQGGGVGSAQQGGQQGGRAAQCAEQFRRTKREAQHRSGEA